MIIKPKGSVTVPKYPRGLGDLIGWARTVNHAIQQLRDRVFDVPTNIQKSVKNDFQFQVSVKKEDSTWKASVTLGYLLFINPKNDADPVSKYWTPETLDDDPAPTFTVDDGEALYIKVITDLNGIPTAVTVESAPNDQATIHYQPPPDDPDAVSIAGEYYYKLAEFSIVDEAMKVKQFQHGGPILHVAELWEGLNIGNGDYPIFKKHNPEDNKYEFRKLEQATGGEAIIVPLTGAIGDEIKFRAVTGRATDPQIDVSADGDLIRVKGNSFDNVLSLAGGQTLTVVDGLISSATDAGSGVTTNVIIKSCDSSAIDLLTLEIENGLITGVQVYGSSIVTGEQPDQIIYLQDCCYVDGA